MLRAKQRLFWIRSAYLVKRISLTVLPQSFLMRFCLNTAWLSHRFAHELVSSVYGSEFHNASFGISEELLRSVIKPSDSVLDVGCGYGRWSHLCAEFAREVVGIDYDPANIAAAQRNAPANCRFALGDVTKDLYGTFDVAILSHLLEHIEESVGFLKLIHARRIVVEVPDFNSNPLNAMRETLQLPFYSDADHIREYTKESLRSDLASANWTVESIESRNGSLVAIARH
jgi:SAM-dependent methyltransferase